MMKYFKIAFMLLLLGAGYGYYMYTKPMSDTSDLKPDFKMSADSLYQHFDDNEALANQKYLGKIIEVRGRVRDLTLGDKGELNLMMASGSDFFGINCEISQADNKKYNNYKIGDTIQLKGECTGILSDVVMTRCVILN